MNKSFYIILAVISLCSCGTMKEKTEKYQYEMYSEYNKYADEVLTIKLKDRNKIIYDTNEIQVSISGIEPNNIQVRISGGIVSRITDVEGIYLQDGQYKIILNGKVSAPKLNIMLRNKDGESKVIEILDLKDYM
ncbi:MAG: hypothetical protein ACI9XP_001881 [Lentimonas sp.]|jgi:hypothetical protein